MNMCGTVHHRGVHQAGACGTAAVVCAWSCVHVYKYGKVSIPLQAARPPFSNLPPSLKRKCQMGRYIHEVRCGCLDILLKLSANAHFDTVANDVGQRLHVFGCHVAARLSH
eukprot:4353804-Amphidinium_carterae.2